MRQRARWWPKADKGPNKTPIKSHHYSGIYSPLNSSKPQKILLAVLFLTSLIHNLDIKAGRQLIPSFITGPFINQRAPSVWMINFSRIIKGCSAAPILQFFLTLFKREGEAGGQTLVDRKCCKFVKGVFSKSTATLKGYSFLKMKVKMVLPG